MRRGPKSKPVELHVAAGTYRADRHGAVIELPLTDLIPVDEPPPKSLKARGKSLWVSVLKSTHELGTLRRSELELLERYCRAADEVAKIDTLLAKEGEYFTNEKTGAIGLHPAARQRFKWLDIMRRCETEMGLTPGSRQNVKPTKTPGKKAVMTRNRQG